MTKAKTRAKKGPGIEQVSAWRTSRGAVFESRMDALKDELEHQLQVRCSPQGSWGTTADRVAQELVTVELIPLLRELVDEHERLKGAAAETDEVRHDRSDQI
jgi:hypothetical protein